MNESYSRFTNEWPEESNKLESNLNFGSNGPLETRDNNLISFQSIIEIFEVSPTGDYFILKLEGESELQMYNMSNFTVNPLGNNILKMLKDKALEVTKQKDEMSEAEKENEMESEFYCFFVKWLSNGIYCWAQRDKRFFKGKLTILTLNEKDGITRNYSSNKLSSFSAKWPSFEKVTDHYGKVTAFFPYLNYNNLDDDRLLFGFDNGMVDYFYYNESTNEILHLLTLDFNYRKLSFNQCAIQYISILIHNDHNFIYVLINGSLYFNILNKNFNQNLEKKLKISGISVIDYDPERDHFVLGFSSGKILVIPSELSTFNLPTDLFNDEPTKNCKYKINENVEIREKRYPHQRASDSMYQNETKYTKNCQNDIIFQFKKIFSVKDKVIFCSEKTVSYKKYTEISAITSNERTEQIFKDYKNDYFKTSNERKENDEDWLTKFALMYFSEDTIWMKAITDKKLLKELLEIHLKLIKNNKYKNYLAFFEKRNIEFKHLEQYLLKIEENKKMHKKEKIEAVNSKSNDDQKNYLEIIKKIDAENQSILLDFFLKDSSSKTQLLVLDSFSSSALTLKFREETAQAFVRITGDVEFYRPYISNLAENPTEYENLFKLDRFYKIVLTNEKENSNFSDDFKEKLTKYYDHIIKWTYLDSYFILDLFVNLSKEFIKYCFLDNKFLPIKYTIGLVIIVLYIILAFLLFFIELIFSVMIHMTLFLVETTLTLLVSPILLKTTLSKYYSGKTQASSSEDSKEGIERQMKIVFISAKEADRIFKSLESFPQSHAIFQSEILAVLIEHRWENETKYIFFRRTYIYLAILSLISVDILYLFAFRPSLDYFEQFTFILINIIMNLSIILVQFYMLWEEQPETVKFRKYITNIWNILDIILIYSGIFSMAYDLYFLITLKEPDDLLKCSMAIFFFLAWFRFLDFLRGIKATSTLLTLLTRVGSEMYGFLFVLLFLIAGLAFTCFLLQSSYDQHNPWDMFQLMYFLLLGDFDGYNSLYKEPETTSTIYRTVFFLIFFISTIFIVIVMLNLLIAIISDAYEKVMLDIKSNETFETLYLINQERVKSSNSKRRDEYFKRMEGRLIIYLSEQQDESEGNDSKDRVRTKITRIEQKLKDHGEDYNRKHTEVIEDYNRKHTEVISAIKQIQEQLSKMGNQDKNTQKLE